MTPLRNVGPFRAANLAIGAAALGALALGAAGIGAFAIGRLIVNRLKVANARVMSVSIDDPTVKRLDSGEGTGETKLLAPPESLQ